MSNTYMKFAPNVFVAKCETEYVKGDIIIIETKYGKEIENEVHNYLGKSRDGFFLYSITRVDGFDSQARAKKKHDRLQGAAEKAEDRSNKYYEASKEGRDFLVLGEPIKIGHHSERRHRKLIERNWERMGKSVAESEKAEEYRRRSEYWKELESKIDLSMPDSLEFFEFELMKAKKEHQLMKDNPELRSHSMSLQYANKKVKDLEEKVYTAIILWGTEEEVAFVKNEKHQKEIDSVCKSDKITNAIKEHGAFFAFNEDQFKEGYQKAKEQGHIEDGEKVVNFGKGLYVPKKHRDFFLKLLKR